MSRVVLQILERYSNDKEYELQKSHDKNPFHTLRYDFKPASVNSDEPASLELSSKGEVTIKAPNIAGSSSNHTVFRGQRRPHVKECLLVIDNRTGEMVLQKLTDNITVKATRTLGGNGAGNTSTSNPQATTQHNSTPNSSGNGASAAAAAGGGGGGGGASMKNSNNHLHASNNANSSNSNTSLRQNNHNHTANTTTTTTTDGPQLSEESSSSSDDDDDDSADDSSDSGSSSSSSSSGSNDEGFTF